MTFRSVPASVPACMRIRPAIPGLALVLALLAPPAPAQPAAGSPPAPSSAEGSIPSGARAASLPDFTALVQQQGPAVVNVVTSRGLSNGRSDSMEEGDPLAEFFKRFFPDAPLGNAPPTPIRGLGSGFIISADGLILTNSHVVADADTVTVRLADGKREFQGKVLGSDPRSDIALVKIEANGLPVARLGNSSSVKPGEWVAAIGSPFGFSNTITAGIVSATGRALPDESFVSFIQTDVAVNPGNSGGPLLNLRGEVIGVNSIIYSRTGGYMGLSFAIPIEAALDVAKQLQTQGKVTRGRLGIGIQPITKELAQAFKLATPTGVVVGQVEPGSPADKAKLRSGDVILSYNGKTIDEASELPRLVAASKPGSQAKLVIWRDGQRQDLAVTVGELGAEKSAAAPPASKQQAANRLGLVVRELPLDARKQLGIEGGVLVEGVVGPALGTEIRPGDVIVMFNQTRISGLAEFNRLVAKQKTGDTVALLVRRGQASVYVPIKVPAGEEKK